MLFTEIIKDNRVYQSCFRRGKFVSCNFLTVYYLPNKLPVNRFGISVSKKNGGAVQRNRIKRIFRAAYRLCETEFPIGYDIIFAARNDASEKTSAEVVRFLRGRAIPAANDPDRKDNKRGQKK
ncbi:MAG: ribonuclease P protein component [Ruminococcus sp.]|nr:ribonuclease P protein component [Ruminococcus sp.]